MGDDLNNAVDKRNNIGGKWYLNVAIPATCSGSINKYKVQVYDNDLEGNYDITLAIWRPINLTTYEIVSETRLEVYSPHYCSVFRIYPQKFQIQSIMMTVSSAICLIDIEYYL